MKSATKHIIISTILCALTLVVFSLSITACRRLSPSTLILPELQILLAPQCCSVRRPVALEVLLELISGYRQPERECKAVYVLYHGCCIRSNGHHDLFGMEVNAPTRTLMAERLFLNII